MRTLALVVLLTSVALTPALADGERAAKPQAKVELPTPQQSVVVTVERGVRVWRPVIGNFGAGDYPQAADYSRGTAGPYASNGYSNGYAPGNGYGSGYGYGYGGFFANNRHDRRFGVSSFPQRAPRFAMGPVVNRPMMGHQPVNVVFFVKPMMHPGPMGHGPMGHGGPGHGGGPMMGHGGKVAYAPAGHGGQHMGGMHAGHPGGHGGHR